MKLGRQLVMPEQFRQPAAAVVKRPQRLPNDPFDGARLKFHGVVSLRFTRRPQTKGEGRVVGSGPGNRGEFSPKGSGGEGARQAHSGGGGVRARGAFGEGKHGAASGLLRPPLVPRPPARPPFRAGVLIDFSIPACYEG